MVRLMRHTRLHKAAVCVDLIKNPFIGGPVKAIHTIRLADEQPAADEQ